MKNRLTIFLLFFTMIANAQIAYQNETDILGIGIVSIANSISAADRVTMYKDKELKNVAKVFNMNSPEKKLYPLFYKPDYGICFFVCTERTDRYFKIVVNKSDELYVAADTNYIYKRWDLLLKHASVKRPDKQNLFRSEPSDMGSIVNLVDKDEKYKVVEVKEDWIKVKNPKTDKEAWLRWRKKDKLLVEIVLVG